MLGIRVAVSKDARLGAGCRQWLFPHSCNNAWHPFYWFDGSRVHIVVIRCPFGFYKPHLMPSSAQNRLCRGCDEASMILQTRH